MKSQISYWADSFIAIMIVTNTLLIVHLLHYGSIEQSAQILAVLLFYRWLSRWTKKL